MTMRARWGWLRAGLVAAASLGLGFAAVAGRGSGATPAEAGEKATFAMGCFWCAETAFEGLPGVASVISGYTGGVEQNPTYEQVSSHRTSHLEAIQVRFDPRVITYAELLDVFWHNVDPTSAGGQFCDRGEQYRSAIFYESPAQRQLAEASKRRLETEPRKLAGEIVTEIVAASTFWPAEDYHQDFYKKNPERYESYRLGCGRDARLRALWGQPGRQGR
jgi:peptide-methionine (S)-S-oxide reductase